MWYNRMELEVWFDRYQYEIVYDIGESAVKTLAFKDIDINLDDVLLRYGYHTGKPSLREVIAEQYPGLSAANILVTTGASEANFAIISALVEPGSHVIVEHPNYPSLYEVPRSMGCEVDLFTLRYENQFKPDLEELSDKIRPETKLVSLTHPNNPTGSMITETELRAVIDLVESHDIFFMFDETYRYMAFGDQLLSPAASLSEKAISISSMSKCYGLPGIRTGWLATKNQSILDKVLAIREQISISNNALSEEIATRVLRQKDDFLANARKRIQNNRAVVSGWMQDQDDVEWIYPEAGVVCFPKIKAHIKVEAEKLYRHLAEKYKTFVVPGRCFEMDERFFRIGFGADAEQIHAGLANLNCALSELK